MKSFFEEPLQDDDRGSSSHYNSLLWNVGMPLGKADMFANPPPRFAVDRLVSRYFNCASPALCKIFTEHRNTVLL